MNRCEELERLLQSLHLDLASGGYQPSLSDGLRHLGDVRPCITQGLRNTADHADWRLFNRYILAAHRQPDPSMAPIAWSVLDRWGDIYASRRDDVSELPHLEDMADILSETGNPGAIPTLERAISNEPRWDEYHHLAKKCIRALASFNTPDSISALRRVARSEVPEIRQEAVEWLETKHLEP